MYVNNDVKLKIGGRKAPKLSEIEFSEKLKELSKKVDPEEYDDEYMQELLDNEDYQFIFYSDNSCFSKLQKDIEKVNVDLENCNPKFGPRLTKNNIPYLTFEVGGDWEFPVCVFVYWDGNHIRAYIPKKGNTWRTDTKSAFGNSEDDHEYLKKYGVHRLSDLDIDYNSCLEDFESRLEVKL